MFSFSDNLLHLNSRIAFEEGHHAGLVVIELLLFVLIEENGRIFVIQVQDVVDARFAIWAIDKDWNGST